MIKLTAIIATRNEEEFIENCLRSVSFADEILVIDSGSTDNTLEIVKKLGARIIKRDWHGFRDTHDFGAAEARGEWLLYLDADERVSKTLKNNILAELQGPIHDAYQVSRLNYFMGRPMRHGGWYPDPMTRLIKKEALKKWVGELHEYPEINGTTGKIAGDLYHLTHRDLTWSLHKTISYTQTNAKLLFESRHPKVKVKNFFGAMAREFYFRAIKNSGWKDGFVGWYEIIYQTFNAFLIQVYLWQMQQKVSLDKQYKQLDERLSEEFNS